MAESTIAATANGIQISAQVYELAMPAIRHSLNNPIGSQVRALS
jgi:hypothetical protein